MRNDEAIQFAAWSLFEGIAPERRGELKALMEKYSPRFNLLEDFSQDGSFVFEAGAYRDVRFNHRVLRAFWVATFAAWEGYRAVTEAVAHGNRDFSKFQAIIDSVRMILSEEKPELVPLPAGIPEPGILPDLAQFPQMRAAAELAHFATGWAFLHEIQHIIHQREGTGTSGRGTSSENHEEEFSCDAYATNFVLDGISVYAKSTGENSELVKQKRELGIYFALFAMAVFAEDKWGESEHHPSLQSRIEAIVDLIRSPTQAAGAIAYLAFLALNTQWPSSPRFPLKAI